MSIALREQKCLRRSTACAGQTRPPVQRRTTSASPVFSSISRNAAEPHTGQTVRKHRKAGSRPAAARATTSRICGMTSPARCTRRYRRRGRPCAGSRPRCAGSRWRRRRRRPSPAAIWPPASARRCARPGSRSPRRWSSPARQGTCARPPSAASAKRSPVAPAARARRPCRRRRRCHSPASRAVSRSRDNARAFPPPNGRAWSAD